MIVYFVCIYLVVGVFMAGWVFHEETEKNSRSVYQAAVTSLLAVFIGPIMYIHNLYEKD